MKINIELDMLHFMVVYQFLVEATNKIEEDKNFSFTIYKEAFQKIEEQFSDQYTEEHGRYFERRHLIRKALFKNQRN